MPPRIQLAIDAFNRKVTQELAPIEVKKLADEIYRRAIHMTPEDTGHLKRSWMIEHKHAPGKEVASEIFNPVEYAIPVEEGTERKRPRRMLARAIAEVRKVL